jgi:cytochrome c peroxidase
LGSSPVGANASTGGGGGPDGLKVNEFGLPGLETQALAGTRLHRLRFDNESALQTNWRYRRMYRAAFPSSYTGFIPEGSQVTPEWLGAAKAIAACERVILSNRAPFQRWLRGNKWRGSRHGAGGMRRAMSTRQLQGALVFFDPDRGNCVACHTGPALSTRPGATADEVFRSVGFPDFDTSDPRIHGDVPKDTALGRGGFTGNSLENYRFKVPQLYNLKDTSILGHGASFSSVREVVEYKVAGIPATDVGSNLDRDFVPLDLSSDEIDVLVEFVEDALYDASLERYSPRRVVSGNCFPVADLVAAIELGC